MNDFARKQLEKYGWTDGKGLGKEENGITKPIQPRVKLDNHGVGHDRVNVLASRWWCDVFNEVSQRVNVVNKETGVQFSNSNPAEKVVLPSSDRMKQKFIKAEVVKEYRKICTPVNHPTDTESVSEASYLSGDRLYQNCHGVKDKKGKSLKAKHKRVLRQDAAYARKIKTKRKRGHLTSSIS